ncbi:aminotransferase class I/II-fold pyridoxal phosphate-dependent enzyme [Pseudoroseomonas wenyumeiae]
MTACLMAVLNPGDEVVLFEPLYDTYLPVIRMLGAVPKLVRLTPPKWDLPRDALAAAFGPKTKAVLLNTPLNPASKVFTAAELAFIADLLQRHDAYAVCDEVYEHLTFDGWKHIPLMTLPGMRGRCMRIGSAGKTFSLTGWKVGYITCDASLAPNVAKAHQLLTFTTPPNLQRAVALGLNKDDSYFGSLGRIAGQAGPAGRGAGEAGLRRAGSARQLLHHRRLLALGFSGDDVAFCRHITEAAKVTAIPVSAFYDNPADAPKHYARFAFCKNDAVLDEALARLTAWKAARAPEALAG